MSQSILGETIRRLRKRGWQIARSAEGYRLTTAKRGETAAYLDDKNTRSRARAAARTVA